MVQTPPKRVLFVRSQRQLWLCVFVALFFLIGMLGLLTADTSAATSDNLNFQARLETADGSIVPDGNYNVEFKLYDSSSSTGSSQGSCTGDASCLWTETRTGANQVKVVDGYLAVNLGSVTAFSGAINWDQQLYLTMDIGGTGATASWDGEMNPRLQLTAVPYAFQAESAHQLQVAQDGYTGTLEFNGLTDNRTLYLPDANGTICTTSGNCVGGGSGGSAIGGGGTAGTIALFGSGGDVIGDSILVQSGTTGITVGGNQIISGNLTVNGAANSAFTGTVSGSDATLNDQFTTLGQVNNLITAGVGNAVTTVGALDGGTTSVNGASINANTIYLQSASSIMPGLVNTTTQTFAGAKTFNDNLTVASNKKLSLGGSLSYQSNSGSAITFASPATYSANQARYASEADFNNDGYNDVVTADVQNNLAYVFMNNGDGTFKTPVTYGVGGYPEWIGYADVNKDGFQDIISSNAATNNVSVLINKGDGTFYSAATYTVGSAPKSANAVDVNNDGYPDLVVPNSNDNNVSVLMNNGNGTFASAVNYSLPASSAPKYAAIVDVNGDGHPDIVTANSGTNNVSVLLNSGSGTFGSPVNYAVGTNPRSEKVVDINHDGHPDIVAVNATDHTISILLNKGDGTFGTQTTYDVGAAGYPVGVDVADINGDGNPDIITANSGNNTISIFPGNGDGTFGSQTLISSGDPRSMNVADVNNDGKLDIVAPDFNDNELVVLMNTTSMVSHASILSVNTGAAGNTGLIIQGNTGQVADLLRLQTTGGSLLFSVDSSGDGDFAGRVSGANAVNANDFITLGQAQALMSGTSAGAILLQATTPGTAQTGNFNISGTGIAGSLLTTNIDTASAGTLNIGTTNAAVINIGSANAVTTFSGQIQSTAGISFQGTMNTTNNTRLYFGGTLASSTTTTQYGIQNSVNFNPQGASLSSVYGIVNTPTLTGSSLNIANFYGGVFGISTSSGYTGKVGTAAGIMVSGPTLGGSQLVTQYYGVSINANTANGGNTTGTLNNMQLSIAGNTAGAGTGGTVNNYGIRLTLPSGTGGITNNYGLYIQGNGSGANGDNYSLYNSSTANSYFAGSVGIGTATPSAKLQIAGTALVNANSSTAFQVQDANGVGILSVDTTTAGGRVIIQGTNANNSSLLVRGASGSTASSISIQGSDGTEYAQIRADANSNLGFGIGATNIGTATGGQNIGLGYHALSSDTTGVANVSIGNNALALNTTGSYNLALGGGALGAATTANYNIGIGDSSGGSITTGSENVGLGYNTLVNTTTGKDNVAIGMWSGYQNTTGNSNTYIGASAGDCLYTNEFCTSPTIQGSSAIGDHAQVQADSSLVLGSVYDPVNVGIGTTVPLNTFSVSPLDYSTGTASQSGTTVTGTGTTWTSNMVGDEFIFNKGQHGVITAVNSASSITLDTSQTVASDVYRIHYAGLNVTSTGKVGIGTFNPQNALSVVGNADFSGTVSGADATANNQFATLGQLNTAIAGVGGGGGGGGSYINLQATTPGTAQTGNFNISGTGIAGSLLTNSLDTASAGVLNVGTTNATSINLGNASSNIQTTINGTALVKSTAGNDSATAFVVQDSNANALFGVDTADGLSWVQGTNAYTAALYVGAAAGAVSLNQIELQDSNGNNLANIGADGNQNLAFGLGAYSGGAGGQNIAIGSYTLYSIDTGGANIAIGGNALGSDVNGSNNIAIGQESQVNSTGGDNVSVGSGSGSSLTTGSGNILLGSSAGNNITTGGQNIIIGYNLQALSATGSNQLNIGGLIQGNTATGSQTLALGGNVTVASDGTSKLTIGSTTNGIVFSPTSGISAYGTAQHVKTLTFNPEYAGAVLDAQNDATCTASTNGTMTSGFDGTDTYYQWASSATTTQCYDVVLRVTVPSDFSSWNKTSSGTGTAVVVRDWTNDTSNATLTSQVLSPTGSVSSSWTDMTPLAANTWQGKGVSGNLSNSWTPGSTFTIQLRTSAANAAKARLGTVQIYYNSSY